METQKLIYQNRLILLHQKNTNIKLQLNIMTMIHPPQPKHNQLSKT